jgi:hypothetical protein
MPCYFLRNGHVAGVEMLPLGLSDEGAIARARVRLSKRRGPLEGFEVWDRARFVFSGLNGRAPVPNYEPASASLRITSL